MIPTRTLRFYYFVRRAPAVHMAPYHFQYEAPIPSLPRHSTSFGKYILNRKRTPQRIFIAQKFLQEKRKTK